VVNFATWNVRQENKEFSRMRYEPVKYGYLSKQKKSSIQQI
jgi:hypothetical protein